MQLSLRTAAATRSNGVLFFEDVYGHDANLKRLLEQDQNVRRE